MKTAVLLFLVLFVLAWPFSSSGLLAQEEKGDLEDFIDDYDDDESSDSDGADFFIWVAIEYLDDFAQLWGKAPGTEVGPFPSHPYAEGDGFMADPQSFRSYFFNTELSYQYLSEDLTALVLKWETQFVHRSKLSFDFAYYQETFDSGAKDYLRFWGGRYGYAVFRSSQVLLNLEVGLRGFTGRISRWGPELGADLQLFPGKPVVIETELAAAYVGNGPLYTVESSAGVLLGRFEFLAGIRILKNKSVDLLDGFRVGLRVWY